MNPVIDKERRVKLDRDEVLHNARHYWIWRRSQDIVLSVLALLILWPWMLLIAIIIVIDSPGASPIFAQERVGRDGKKFTFYKFRSMKPNAEAELDDLLDQNEMDGPVFKIKKDPRITRVGRFIRRASIDELPQLWNVLRGEMSIVGPRPSLVREAEQYDDYARQRLYVTPGLTCYWQIQPNRNDMSFDEWVELDLKYIQERSFWVDWMIIFKTFQAVFGMNGV
jgi:lipopolysaccharide/colanic/teichoic acid biosynthesis glycosyltransferase